MRKQLTISQVPTGSLRANPYNTNVVSPNNEEKIKESIRRFGFFKPILVRTLSDGSMEIVGGEHRWQAAKDLGFDHVDVIDLGEIDDIKAKQISLIDNGRYGQDDNYKLAELLSEIGTLEDLSTFMPYSDQSLTELFENNDLDLDSLDLDEDEVASASPPKEKPVQKYVIMRFKIPVADSQPVQNYIEKIMDEQGFTDGDSLLNAGDALIYICSQNAKS